MGGGSLQASVTTVVATSQGMKFLSQNIQADFLERLQKFATWYSSFALFGSFYYSRGVFSFSLKIGGRFSWSHRTFLATPFPWLPLPGWYGCAHASGTGQAGGGVGVPLALSFSFGYRFKIIIIRRRTRTRTRIRFAFPDGGLLVVRDKTESSFAH